MLNDWKIRASLLPVSLLAAAAVFPAAPGYAQDTQLGKTAAQMSPGQWREYTSSNWGREFAEAAPGSNVSILDFSQRMHWDPVRKQLWMWGKGHGAPSAKLIKFEAVNDRWVIMPDPTPFTSTGHAYDEQAIDVNGRYLYKKQHSDTRFHRMNLDTGKWESNLFDMGSGAPAQAIEIFPDFEGGAAIINYDANTGLTARSLATGQERDLYTTGPTGKSRDIENGKNHQFIVYEPIHRLMVLGGGNGDTSVNYTGKHIYKLDRSNKLTRLDDIPAKLNVPKDGDEHYLGPGSARGVMCPGGNGKLYAYKMVADGGSSQNGLHFELDPMASSGQQWKQMPNSPLDETSVNDWFVCTLIPEYDVIVFNTWNGDKSKMFLFKPGVCQDCPPVDVIPPEAPTGLSTTD